MATGVFSLRKVYIKQNENIDNRNFASWPESATYGYFGGGNVTDTITYSNLVIRLDFSNEILSNPGKNFPIAITTPSCVSSSFYGYFAGGFNAAAPGRICTIYRLDFSTETLSLPGKDLPSARSSAAFVSSSSYGYFGGGVLPPNISTITRLDFSSETVSDPGKNLPDAKSGINNSTVQSNSYGYFGGGYTFPPATWYNTITRLDFSNETVSNPGKDLPSARQGTTGTQSSSYGYLCGGASPPFPTLICTISRLDFSNETTSNPGKNFTSRTGSSPVSNNFYGYFCGGNAPTPTDIISTITRLDFSNETVSDPGNNFSAVRRAFGSLSGGASVYRGSKTYGYMIGGYGANYVSTVSRLDFSSEVISNPGNNYPTSSIGNFSGAVSSNYYGYFGGGYTPAGPQPTSRICTITRLDFSNETLTNPGKNLPTVNSTCGGVSSNNYGYFGGGYRYSFPLSVPALRLCTITRLDFSTENVNNITSTLLGFGIDSMATVMSNSYGYFGGGLVTAPFTSSSNITRLDFYNETTSAPPTKLPTNNFELAALSSNSYGYFGGGLFPPGAPGATATNAITRLDFSNETVSLPAKNLPTALYRQSTVPSKFYGYFIGGSFPIVNTVSRIDFSNETISAPGKNNLTPISQSATFSNSN